MLPGRGNGVVSGGECIVLGFFVLWAGSRMAQELGSGPTCHQGPSGATPCQLPTTNNDRPSKHTHMCSVITNKHVITVTVLFGTAFL